MTLKIFVIRTMFLKLPASISFENFGSGTKLSSHTNAESVGAPTGQAEKHSNAVGNGSKTIPCFITASAQGVARLPTIAPIVMVSRGISLARFAKGAAPHSYRSLTTPEP